MICIVIVVIVVILMVLTILVIGIVVISTVMIITAMTFVILGTRRSCYHCYHYSCRKDCCGVYMMHENGLNKPHYYRYWHYDYALTTIVIIIRIMLLFFVSTVVTIVVSIVLPVRFTLVSRSLSLSFILVIITNIAIIMFMNIIVVIVEKSWLNGHNHMVDLWTLDTILNEAGWSFQCSSVWGLSSFCAKDMWLGYRRYCAIVVQC